MAILFIGPHRNPDFASDYHLSPVLAPSHLLAQFPPLLMTCGEKDPFVDDTVIFAGRLREAKRARMKELSETLAGKNTKYGEHLTTTILSNDFDSNSDEGSFRALKRELNELSSQTEEDWVQMHIFTDWSHGYMQMAPLMKEAAIVINDLADWMDSIFVGQRGRGGRKLNMIDTSASWRQQRRHGRGSAATTTPLTSETEMETETDDVLMFSTAKKRSPPPSFSGTGKATRKDSSYTKQNVLSSVSSPHQTPRESSQLRSRPETANPAPLASIPPRLATPTQVAAGLKVGSPKGGQTITESELMRRRRLLDAHLIQSDTVKPANKA